MKEEQFIKINSNTWKKLEELTKLINKRGAKSLSSKEVKNFLSIFRQTSHHLAYARTYYKDGSTVEYLNSLLSKAHSHVYGVKRFSVKELVYYILQGFPNLLRKYKWYVLASFAFFAFGMLLSLILVYFDINNAKFFLPQQYINGAGAGGSKSSQWNYPLMSSQIMVNNILVSLRAFVFGITLGLGTIYVLFFNGAMLGALTALMYIKGNPVQFWSLILPHGITELTAIFISGAAGLIIAKSILLPGEHSRKDALIKASKQAASLILGVILMLVIAGIIEGFFTPLNISETIKLIFAGITAVILAVYFASPYFTKNLQAKI